MLREMWHQMGETINKLVEAKEGIEDEFTTIAEEIANMRINEESSSDNPVGELQELCMRRCWRPPVYESVDVIGLPHDRTFQYICRLESMDLREFGIGKTKKSAKRESARNLLVQLQRTPEASTSTDEDPGIHHLEETGCCQAVVNTYQIEQCSMECNSSKQEHAMLMVFTIISLIGRPFRESHHQLTEC